MLLETSDFSRIRITKLIKRMNVIYLVVLDLDFHYVLLKLNNFNKSTCKKNYSRKVKKRSTNHLTNTKANSGVVGLGVG